MNEQVKIHSIDEGNGDRYVARIYVINKLDRTDTHVITEIPADDYLDAWHTGIGFCKMKDTLGSGKYEYCCEVVKF